MRRKNKGNRPAIGRVRDDHRATAGITGDGNRAAVSREGELRPHLGGQGQQHQREEQILKVSFHANLLFQQPIKAWWHAERGISTVTVLPVSATLVRFCQLEPSEFMDG